MKIDSSAVKLTSDRTYAKTETTTSVMRTLSTESTEKETNDDQAIVAQKTSAMLSESEDYLVSLNSAKPSPQSLVEDALLGRLKTRLCGGEGANISRLDEENELSLIEQILNAFDKAAGKKPRFKALRQVQAQYARMESMSFEMSNVAIVNGKSPSASGRVAKYAFSQSTVRLESESTSFTAQGVARTEDGREISFNVDVYMSREFMEKSSFSALLDEQGRKVDPLVINLKGNVASVRDQKFFFDIDADGTAEEISRMGDGSGLLALDRNGDGVINDGSELFGARTGDGFSELAAYDEDGNGWIDEGDSIFNNLRIWIQDEDGTDRLVALAKADVGAIYLGSASTDFSLTDTTADKADAMIRRSGVYLKESGGVGTVQHMDFII